MDGKLRSKEEICKILTNYSNQNINYLVDLKLHNLQEVSDRQKISQFKKVTKKYTSYEALDII